MQNLKEVNTSQKDFTQVWIKGLGLVWASLEAEIKLTFRDGKRSVKICNPKVICPGGHQIEFATLPKDVQQALIRHRIKSLVS